MDYLHIPSSVLSCPYRTAMLTKDLLVPSGNKPTAVAEADSDLGNVHFKKQLDQRRQFLCRSVIAEVTPIGSGAPRASPRHALLPRPLKEWWSSWVSCPPPTTAHHHSCTHPPRYLSGVTLCNTTMTNVVTLFYNHICVEDYQRLLVSPHVGGRHSTRSFFFTQ